MVYTRNFVGKLVTHVLDLDGSCSWSWVTFSFPLLISSGWDGSQCTTGASKSVIRPLKCTSAPTGVSGPRMIATSQAPYFPICYFFFFCKTENRYN